MPFVEILLIGLSGALLAKFYNSLLDEDMILEKLGVFLDGNEWWKKPLGGCVYCTTPYLTGSMLVLYLFLPFVWSVVFAITLGFFLITIFDRYELL